MRKPMIDVILRRGLSILPIMAGRSSGHQFVAYRRHGRPGLPRRP
jgi:hypothetical protein